MNIKDFKEKVSAKVTMNLVDLIIELINELVNTNVNIIRKGTVVASSNRDYVILHKFISCEDDTITEVYADGCYGLIGIGKMGRLRELDLSTLVSIYEYLIEYSKDLNGR